MATVRSWQIYIKEDYEQLRNSLQVYELELYYRYSIHTVPTPDPRTAAILRWILHVTYPNEPFWRMSNAI